MTTVYAPQFTLRAPVTNRWARNGKYPDAWLHNDLAAQCNHAARFLTKEVFTYSVPLVDMPNSSGSDRDRWRFSWRSGPYARYLWAHVIAIGPQEYGGADPTVLITILDGAASTVGTMEMHVGSAFTASETPSALSTATLLLGSGGAPVELTADTEYFGVVTDQNQARVVAITIFETSIDATIANGYTPMVSAGSPIFDTDRSTIATMARNMWKQGAAHLLNWTVDVQASPRTTTSATEVNLIDTALTGAGAYGANAPGFVLDLSNRTRVSGTGIPITVKAYASKGTGDGTVLLCADTSDTLAQVSVTGAAAWYSTTATIDTSFFGDLANALCHLSFNSAGGTCSVYAVSVYQYE